MSRILIKSNLLDDDDVRVDDGKDKQHIESRVLQQDDDGQHIESRVLEQDDDGKMITIVDNVKRSSSYSNSYSSKG